jgi:predicted flavoprotein YhiN
VALSPIAPAESVNLRNVRKSIGKSCGIWKSFEKLLVEVTGLEGSAVFSASRGRKAPFTPTAVTISGYSCFCGDHYF